MTVDPVPDDDHVGPRWPVPPPGGYTADHLDTLPDLPAHTELVDGSLVFVSPQTIFHMRVVSYLARTLEEQAPATHEVCRQMTVTLGPRQRPEPDVMIADAAADTGLGQTTYQPQDVVLTVEVVSPDSEERDRKRKPLLYAEAGIPHFWRIENAGDRAVAYVYELDPATRQYALTGIHHDRLRLDVPFGIDLDLIRATQR